MAYKLVSELLRQYTGPRTARAVLLVLADHADGNGLAWPSVATIAERTGLQRRQVQTHLSRLIAAGYLRIVGSRTGGRAHSTRFQIIVNPAVDCTVSNEKAGNSPHGFATTHGKTTVQSDAGKGAVHCAKGCSPLPERVQSTAPEAIKNLSRIDQEATNPHVRAREQQPLDREQTTATPVCKENPNGCAPVVAPNAVPLLPTTNIPAADQPEALAALARSWNVVSFPGQSAGELRARLIRRQAEVGR